MRNDAETIQRTFQHLREYTDPRGHHLLDALEELVTTERQTANLALAILRARAQRHAPVEGYVLDDPKLVTLDQQEHNPQGRPW